MSYCPAIRISIKLILIYKLKSFLLMIKGLLMQEDFLGSGSICASFKRFHQNLECSNCVKLIKQPIKYA